MSRIIDELLLWDLEVVASTPTKVKGGYVLKAISSYLMDPRKSRGVVRPLRWAPDRQSEALQVKQVPFQIVFGRQEARAGLEVPAAVLQR
jgi:hypothetical protein